MNLKPVKKSLLIAALSTLTPLSLAQEELDPEIANQLSLEALYQLPILEIATGYAVPLEKAPSVATVITAEDIKAMGAMRLEDILESVPGLHILPSTLTPAHVPSIRGMMTSQTPQVLLLLNGHRISSGVYMGLFPSTGVINVQNISRVEVVRGPGSAIYGADAFSGVVNIVTKTAKEINGFKAGIRGGSFSTKNIWGQYGGRFGNGWKLALNLEYMDQGPDKSRIVNSDSQTGLDALFGTSASLAPSYLDYRYKSTTYNAHLSNQNWKFGIDGWAQRDIGQGPGIAQALDDSGSADIDQILLSLEYNTKDWYPHLDFTGKFSHQYIDQQYYFRIFPPGNVSLIGSDGNLFTAPLNAVLFTDGVRGNPGRESTASQADFTFLYSGIKDHTLRFNFGLKKEDLKSKETKNFGPSVIDGTEGVVDGTLTDVTGTDFTYTRDKSRTVKYISLQEVWDISPDWILTAGVRYDNYSDFGGTTNPRIALVWTATEDLIAKLLYGKAFRAPAFAELYNRHNPVTQGNPDLDPEVIDTYELAFSYELAHNFNAGLSLYYYKAEDMIDFIVNPDESATAQNFNSFKGTGLEIEANWEINKEWTVIANYAFQKTISEATDNQHHNVPKHQFYLDARWAFMPDWLASAQLNWVADRKRAEGDTRKEIDDYTLVNLTLRRSNLAKHWEVAASIKNLFDEDVREPSNGAIPDDYPMNERSFFVELSYHY